MYVQLLAVGPDPHEHIVQTILHRRQIGYEFEAIPGKLADVFIIEQGKAL